MSDDKRAGAGSSSTTRDSSPASASRLDAVLDEIDEFLEDQEDVRDGSDGPLPNKAMTLLQELRAARTLRSETAPITDNDKRWRFLEHGCQWVSFIPIGGEQRSYDPRVVSKTPGVGLVAMREAVDAEAEKHLKILREGINAFAKR